MGTTTEISDATDLGSVTLAEVAVAGAKAARLGELMAAGFQVPEGFVLTTSVFGRADAAMRAIALGLRALGTDVRVAVRSSAVAEDLDDASFAGQYETVLGVSGEAAVLAAVKRCWASAASARVAEYSKRIGSTGGGEMAVLVQRMVEADAAGVAYSANPVTGDRQEAVVSAVRGLGERLVSGTAAPDEWVVGDGAPRCTRASEGAIDADQAQRIAQLARRVAERMGEPQDIEWALAGDILYLLQTRPITALPGVLEWKAPAPGGFARHFRFGEWLGDPVTTLFESWLIEGLESGLDQEFRRSAGIRVPRPFHVVVNGWYFYSMNFLPKSAAALLGMLPGFLFKLVTQPRRASRAIPTMWRFNIEQSIYEWKREVRPRHLDAVRRAADLVEKVTPQELVKLVDDLAADAAVYFMALMSVAGSSAKAELPLDRIYRQHLESSIGGSYFDLLQGLFTPDLGATDHAVQSLDWFFPTLGELDVEIEAPEASAARRQRLGDVRLRAEARAREPLAAQPKVLAEFEKVLAMAQRLQPLREEQALEMTLGWPVMRKALARLGGALVARSVIDDPGEIYFLTKDEVTSAVGPLGATARARRDEWERRRRLTPPLIIGELDPRMKSAMDHFTGSRQGRTEAAGALTGIAASPGRATGIARIIRQSEDFARLQKGDVLVAPATTPAWTMLFARAVAVVTDTGSIGSHSSQVAREYGIPAVVCTGDATRRLTDGEPITVDGSAGVVTRAHQMGVGRGPDSGS